MKGSGPYVVDEIEYKNLNAEMNQFYDKSYEDVDAVKPLMVKEGQVKSLLYCVDRNNLLLHWFGGEVSKICINLLFSIAM